MNYKVLVTAMTAGAILMSGASSVKASTTHEVQAGETLSAIANTNGTTVRNLVQLNSISNANLIYPGDSISISTNSVKSNYTQSSTVSSGWTTMEATAYDPQVASGGQGTSIPTGTGVAANLSRYPKGTRLQIKYQDGHIENRVVNDTGEFAYSNSNQLDISMSNAQALRFGRQSIQVRVLG